MQGMLFSLEAMKAKHGDSLLLHYGDAKEPRLIVIDGGPPGVFTQTLRPRLEALREKRGGKLRIEVLMISHIDDDHIRGVLDFATTLENEPQLQSDFDVRTLWLNSFEDMVAGGGPVEPGAGSVPADVGSGELSMVVANVKEGRGLRLAAEKLHWKPNVGFNQFVMAPDDDGVEIDLAPLKLTVVGPRKAELDELEKTWAKEVKNLKDAAADKVSEIAAYLDDSVYNLSSIVCVAELGKKRMLLTGDARGDKILLGLEAAGFLKQGESMELDLLKVPHHGSSRDLTTDFFERVRAKEMVISADGEYNNPDIETLEMISAARPDDDFTIHLTYHEYLKGMGPKILGFFAEEEKKGRRYKVLYRAEEDPSLRVDLLDPVTE